MINQLPSRIALGLLALSVWNCKTSDPEPTPYDEGAYILNAGNFSDNNGTISFLRRDSKVASTDIFSAANARSLKGSLQGYTELNGKGMILVDNTTAGQDKVEIVEVGTFKSRASLGAPDIENPRYAISVGPNKAYVSCWDVTGDYSKGTFYKDPGYIAVVDLNTSTVIKKIPALKGVERMVATDSEVFVGSDPGYAPNTGANTLLVIDLNTDAVKQRIDFSAPPQPVGLDATGKLWLSVGNDLIRMDPTNRTIEKRQTLAGTPGSIVFTGDRRIFYYMLGGKTYQYQTATSSTSQVVSRSFSGLGVDPKTGIVYGGVTPSYKQAGYVLRFQPGGALIDSVRAEIAPSGFYFR